jgi:hypothetical protein
LLTIPSSSADSNHDPPCGRLLARLGVGVQSLGGLSIAAVRYRRRSSSLLGHRCRVSVLVLASFIVGVLVLVIVCPDPDPCVVRRRRPLGRLPVSVWRRLSSSASTHNPPCEQLLAELVADAGSSVSGVGWLWLWCRSSSSPIPHSCRLSSVIPCLRCPFSVGHRLVIHPASRGSQRWHSRGHGVVCLGGCHYNMFRT